MKKSQLLLLAMLIIAVNVLVACAEPPPTPVIPKPTGGEGQRLPAKEITPEETRPFQVEFYYLNGTDAFVREAHLRIILPRGSSIQSFSFKGELASPVVFTWRDDEGTIHSDQYVLVVNGRYVWVKSYEIEVKD